MELKLLESDLLKRGFNDEGAYLALGTGFIWVGCRFNPVDIEVEATNWVGITDGWARHRGRLRGMNGFSIGIGTILASDYWKARRREGSVRTTGWWRYERREGFEQERQPYGVSKDIKITTVDWARAAISGLLSCALKSEMTSYNSSGNAPPFKVVWYLFACLFCFLGVHWPTSPITLNKIDDKALLDAASHA